MKNVLKKNQIMITALAIMIAIAGYLNFAGNQLQEEELVTANANDTQIVEEAALDISDEDNAQANALDIESMDSDLETANTDMLDVPVEMASTDQASTDQAVTSEQVAGTGEITEGEIPGEAVFTSANSVGSLSGAKLLKEQTRAKNKETLLEIINNEKIDNTQKQQAIDSMISLTDTAEKETSAEILLEAKGFSDVVVSIDNNAVDVMVNAAQLSDAKRAQIEDIVKRKTGVPAENIIITPIGTQ